MGGLPTNLFFKLLLPLRIVLSWVYALVSYGRNKLYDNNFLACTPSPIFSICVGNISAGGTGKTPFVAYLLKNLPSNLKIALLSRGYGRNTKGYLEAKPNMSAESIGDEPYLLYHKFNTQYPLHLCGDRVFGINQINVQKTDVVLLDDGFQHRALQKSVSIVLMDYQYPIWENKFLPWGTLRESANALLRAQIIVITKCPNSIQSSEKEIIKNKILNYNTKLQVYFTGIEYGQAIPFGNGQKKPFHKVVVVSSIANASLFSQYVSEQYHIIENIQYPDHHYFTDQDIAAFEQKMDAETSLICTEKDYVKLKDRLKVSAFYIPMECILLEQQHTLIQYLIEQQQSFKTK
jgi:tetraacyldisaccharide 4'-kinase